MENRNQKIAALALCLSVSVASSGCLLHKNVKIADVPQGVEERNVRLWYEATGQMKVISATMLSVTKATIALHELNPQAFDSEETYQNLLTVYERIALAGKRGNQILGEIPKHFDENTEQLLVLVFDRILEELQKAELELFGVKNPDSKQKLRALLATVRITIQAFNLMRAS